MIQLPKALFVILGSADVNANKPDREYNHLQLDIGPCLILRYAISLLIVGWLICNIRDIATGYSPDLPTPIPCFYAILGYSLMSSNYSLFPLCNRTAIHIHAWHTL
jgi:hypothetical protein